MKLEDEKKIKLALSELQTLKEKRGRVLLDFHKKCANDSKLLEAFIQQYDACNAPQNAVMERKYRELILLALGCANGVKTTIMTHAKLAQQNGATVEEIAEVLRLVFFYCGASKLIPAVEIFDVLPGSEEL